MAMTADGKVATSTRSVHTFGSPRDSRHLYELRAQSDAIVCGARTVEETGATMGNGGDAFSRRRIRDGRSPFPLRVIVSGTASISPTARIWQARFSPIHVWIGPKAPTRRVRQLERLADAVWRSPVDPMDFRAALVGLARDHGVRSVMLEGGGALNEAFLRAGLVDELHLTWCPLIFGGRNAPTIADGIGEPLLAAAPRFHLTRVLRRGNELFLVYRPARA
jgi:5-amino-6-(5-phosphoribosylamino)uracil reductase/2,5-diamino-6-(ribosylamino)-4(3H)-pyrimidinone 5'-phosphate reductase